MALFGRKKQEEEFAHKPFDPVIYTIDTSGVTGTSLFANSSEPLAVDVVYACVGIRADIMASLPLQVFEPTGEANGSQRRIFDHPVAEIFNRKGNQFQTPYELKEYLQQGFDLTGNGYAQIVRNGRGDLVDLLPLYPESVSPWVDEDNNLLYGYGDDSFEAEDIMHIKGLGGIVEGKSPISLLANTLNTYKGSQGYNNKFYNNGAKPSGVVESDGPLKKDVRDALEANLNTNYKGDSAGKTLVLTNGLRFKPISLSANDAQLIQTMNFSMERIAAVYRVPPHLLQSSNIRPSYASSEANSQDFIKYAIRGLVTRWESVINKQLFSNRDKQRGLYAKFNLDALLRADLSTRYNSYVAGINNGFLEINEARRLENLPPLPSGDVSFRPLNMGILGQSNSNEEGN